MPDEIPSGNDVFSDDDFDFAAHAPSSSQHRFDVKTVRTRMDQLSEMQDADRIAQTMESKAPSADDEPSDGMSSASSSSMKEFLQNMQKIHDQAIRDNEGSNASSSADDALYIHPNAIRSSERDQHPSDGSLIIPEWLKTDDGPLMILKDPATGHKRYMWSRAGYNMASVQKRNLYARTMRYTVVQEYTAEMFQGINRLTELVERHKRVKRLRRLEARVGAEKTQLSHAK